MIYVLTQCFFLYIHTYDDRERMTEIILRSLGKKLQLCYYIIILFYWATSNYKNEWKSIAIVLLFSGRQQWDNCKDITSAALVSRVQWIHKVKNLHHSIFHSIICWIKVTLMNYRIIKSCIFANSKYFHANFPKQM